MSRQKEDRLEETVDQESTRPKEIVCFYQYIRTPGPNITYLMSLYGKEAHDCNTCRSNPEINKHCCFYSPRVLEDQK